MEDRDAFDKYLKEELNKIYTSPEHINRELLTCRDEGKFNIINLIFFIASILQSLGIILIGIVFVTDIFVKICTIGFGLFLLNFSLSVYVFINNREDVLI